jgi:hypothetical protein
MASQFDDSDFIDRDFQSSQASYSAAPGHNGGSVTFRPPSRGELDTRVGAAHQKLAELKRAQEELERERAALEDARRRRLELQTGREEMLQSLTRGVELLQQTEFNARREAEQTGKTLANLRAALAAVDGIHEDAWTQENWNVELSKALASIESARMEWNQARLKWALLDGPVALEPTRSATASPIAGWEGRSFWDSCKLGLALTWPVALVGLLGVVLLLVFRTR